MVKVVYVELDGERIEHDVPEGWTVMQAAVRNGVDGIEAECGGSCCCATCHVYVDDTYVAKLEDASDMEDDMLDDTVAERKDNSRLGCQIKLTADLDGIVVHIPDGQS